ncbi:MAG: hypothetical protein QM756_42815 [Polyangiaceae bacterium]
MSFGLVGCEDGARFDPGFDAQLFVEHGAFVRETLPRDSGGPEVLATYLGRSYFSRATARKSFSGVLAPSASAVALELEGDRGHWVVPSGFPFPESPGTTSFDAPLSFSATIANGPHRLWVAAADEAGRYGAARSVDFTLTEQVMPASALTVSLFWDTASDLDLHLILPDGTEIYRDQPNSWRPPTGSEPTVDAWQSGGLLDFDSNARCTIDGRNNENIWFRDAPPAGQFTVRVDAFSLCSEVVARFRVEVRLGEERIATASGTLTSSATRFDHAAGAGLSVLTFSVEQP